MTKPEQGYTSDNDVLNPEWVKDLYISNQKALKDVLAKHSNSNIDPFNMARAYMDAMFSLWRNPAGLLEAQKNYLNDSIKLWQYTSERMLGRESEPVIAPKPEDRRWRNTEWSNNLIYDYLKQSYLLAARCAEDTIDSIDDLPANDLRKLTFFHVKAGAASPWLRGP